MPPSGTLSGAWKNPDGTRNRLRPSQELAQRLHFPVTVGHSCTEPFRHLTELMGHGFLATKI